MERGRPSKLTAAAEGGCSRRLASRSGRETIVDAVAVGIVGDDEDPARLEIGDKIATKALRRP